VVIPWKWHDMHTVTAED